MAQFSVPLCMHALCNELLFSKDRVHPNPSMWDGLVTCFCQKNIVEVTLCQSDSNPQKRLCGLLLFFFLHFKKFILIGGYLLYNNVVVFAIHSHEPTMGVHVFPILNPPATFLLSLDFFPSVKLSLSCWRIRHHMEDC